jgi:hypothetical protein
VRRTYNANAANASPKSPFGRGWDINFGRIVHTSGHLNEVCSNAAAESMILELPDGSRETLHKSNGAGNTISGSDYLTTSFWKGQCDSGGGVIMYSPDGTRYDMTLANAPYWHASRITGPIRKQLFARLRTRCDDRTRSDFSSVGKRWPIRDI